MSHTCEILRFSLRPEANSRGYYRVFIFPNKATMLAFWKEQVRLSPSLGGFGHFEAQCSGWLGEKKRTGRTKCRGQLLFHRDYIGAGIVSHEMTHAARYWLQRCKTVPDERMARIVGRMTASFWRHWYALVPECPQPAS